MPLDPTWSEADAALLRADPRFASTTQVLTINQPESPANAGDTVGVLVVSQASLPAFPGGSIVLGPGTATVAYVRVYLSADTLYQFATSFGVPWQGVEPELAIYTEAGRRLRSIDGAVVPGVEDAVLGARVDTIIDFRPDATGWHVLEIRPVSGAAGFGLLSGASDVAPFDRALDSDETPDRLDIYRFYNVLTKTHFYTASAAERDYVIGTFGQFVYEGNRFDTAESAGGAVSVHRFYNVETQAHFYTANAAERDQVLATLPQYRYEGVAYTAYASATEGGGAHNALYRFYNTETKTHFYTDSAAEKAYVEATFPQFRYEFVSYYVDAAF